MDTKEKSDEQIVIAVLNNDKEVYREIIRRYEHKLSHYLRKFIGDKDDIEDILQVVFIKTYKNLYGFDVSKKFSSWIYRIAHNEAVNYYKKKKAARISLDDIEYKLLDEKVNLNDQADKMLLKSDIEKIISLLDIKHREPLILFYFENKTYEEIGDILRMPESTVGTLIFRGRNLIKENLREIKEKHGK